MELCVCLVCLVFGVFLISTLEARISVFSKLKDDNAGPISSIDIRSKHTSLQLMS